MVEEALTSAVIAGFCYRAAMRSLFCLLVALISLPPVVMVQDSMTVIKAAHLIDPVVGKMLTDQVIVISGDRIAAFGAAADILVPADAQLIDLGTATVLPGLIDAHVHLTNDYRQQGYQKLQYSIPRMALHGAYNARRTLEAGFTAVRNLGAAGYSDIAIRDAIVAGELPGPRMRVSGPPIGSTGGHCDSNWLPPRYQDRAAGVADGPWAIREKVRETRKFGADIIKFCATGGVLSKGDPVGDQQLTQEEMNALVDEAHRMGFKVAAHAHGAEGINAAIEAGVDSVEHASLIDERGIRLAKRRGTVLVMDIYVDTYILEHGTEFGLLPESLEKEKEIGQLQRDNFRKAHNAGVKMVFGSDAAIFPHGTNAKQFAYMVEYGMSPMEAIQAATVNAAELLGWGEDIGTIAPGYFADIIAVAGNPLENVTVLEDVRFVMQGGKVVKQ